MISLIVSSYLFSVRSFLQPKKVEVIASRLVYIYTKDLILNQDIINHGQSENFNNFKLL